MPMPPGGTLAAVIWWLVASKRHNRSLRPCAPARKQVVPSHAELESRGVDEVGVATGCQCPLGVMNSAVASGPTPVLDVPAATQKFELVHATCESGTEMLAAGTPSTLGAAFDVLVPQALKTSAAHARSDVTTTRRGGRLGKRLEGGMQTVRRVALLVNSRSERRR